MLVFLLWQYFRRHDGQHQFVNPHQAAEKAEYVQILDNVKEILDPFLLRNGSFVLATLHVDGHYNSLDYY